MVQALEKFGPTNLNEAESWLRELAKKEGWAKAEKSVFLFISIL